MKLDLSLSRAFVKRIHKNYIFIFFRRKNALILRTQLTVRVHAVIGKWPLTFLTMTLTFDMETLTFYTCFLLFVMYCIDAWVICNWETDNLQILSRKLSWWMDAGLTVYPDTVYYGSDSLLLEAFNLIENEFPLLADQDWLKTDWVRLELNSNIYDTGEIAYPI